MGSQITISRICRTNITTFILISYHMHPTVLKRRHTRSQDFSSKGGTLGPIFSKILCFTYDENLLQILNYIKIS
jgi:hypothetical protein